MARNKSDIRSLPTKKAAVPEVAAKRTVGRPKKVTKEVVAATPKRRGRPPKSGIQKTAVKKSIPAAKTSSLVNAQPLSSISPSNTEQMVYESTILDEPVETAAAPVAKKEKLRPATAARAKAAGAKSELELAPAPTTVPTSDEITKHPQQAKPAAVSSVASKRMGISGFLRKVLLASTVLVLLAGGWYMLAHRTPNYAAENSKLVAAVNKLAVLPKDETPSVTTVVDETKINQEFLRNAKKGDKVLLYFQAGRAVVYRPSSGQIVNMGPLETPKPRVFIRRGSTIDNTAAVRSAIVRTSDFLLASQDESPNKSYGKTVVVDVTGNRPDLAGKLAQMLHVNVVPLPAGEDRPDADLLVIVGSELQ